MRRHRLSFFICYLPARRARVLAAFLAAADLAAAERFAEAARAAAVRLAEVDRAEVALFAGTHVVRVVALVRLRGVALRFARVVLVVAARFVEAARVVTLRFAGVVRVVALRFTDVDRVVAARFADALRVAVDLLDDAAARLRLLFLAAAFLAVLALPDPLFLPPPEIKLTVAQARRSASSAPRPRSL
ncbi:MAG TPA: hypothetical protein VI479_08775 [Blastocatellia bacterium]